MTHSMILKGKHTSYDDSPDLPYFSRKKKSGSECHREDGPSSSSGSNLPNVLVFVVHA